MRKSDFLPLRLRLRHHNEDWVGDRVTPVICNFSLPVASNTQLQLH